MLNEIENKNNYIKPTSSHKKEDEKDINKLPDTSKISQQEKTKDIINKSDKKKIKDSENELKFEKKYLKARNKTRDLFGRHIDTIRLKNEIKDQRNKIEKQRKKIELSYKRARKRTIDLYGKHTDLKKAKKRIEAQQGELLKSNKQLERKNKEVCDSLDYAKKIQDAILPSEKDIKKHITDFFILFKPRDIVSGDFFWFHKTQEKLYFAVADCTGHGIPGAFMSMISNALLNSIIIDDKYCSPSSILQELNKRITHALKQNDINNDQSDGMDISLCYVDTKTREIEIASANQDTYLFINNDLTQIENDLFSVGGNLIGRAKPEYTNYHFQIEENSVLYLLSDGFKDQFGGPKNKKFGIKNLQQLLVNMQEYPLTKQKELFNNEFLKWKGNTKQIDDVLLVGIDLNSILGTGSV